MADYETISAAWIESGDLDFSEPKDHPDDTILQLFLDRGLPVKLRPSTANMQRIVEGTVKEWFSPDVRAHLSICSICTQKLNVLRSTERNNSGVQIVFKNSKNAEKDRRVRKYFPGITSNFFKNIFRILFRRSIAIYYLILKIAITIKQKILRKK